VTIYKQKISKKKNSNFFSVSISQDPIKKMKKHIYYFVLVHKKNTILRVFDLKIEKKNE